MRVLRSPRLSRLVAILLALLPVVAGCSTPTSPAASRLRLINRGAVTIQGLVVQFPESTVSFGNLAAGATTDYRQVPRGVYRYSAYQFMVGGILKHQPVIDWVGESPMDGSAFTYTLELVAGPSGVPWVELKSVSRDE